MGNQGILIKRHDMKRVHRIDQRSKLTKVVKTDEGFLQVTAPIARTGIYLYRNSDGSITRELVPEDTLFHKDSLATLQMKPVTNVHPTDFVTASNAKDNLVGTVGQNFIRDGDKLVTDFVVTHQQAIDSIESGREEISPGYDCDLEFTAGKTDSGEEYDAIQRNRVYNHVALVDAARGGREITLRADAEDNTGVQINDREDNEINPIDGAGNMNKILLKVDGVEVEVDGASAQKYLDKANSRADTAESALETEKTAHTTTQAKADSVCEELSALKAKRSDSDEITTAVVAKVALMDTARSICGEEAIKVTHSDEAIKTAVILAKFPKADLEGKSPEYLKARYDMAVELHNDSDNEREVAGQRRDLQRNHTDGGNNTPSATQKRHSDEQEAWKKGSN